MEPDPDEELFVGRREPLGIGLASDPENRFDKILFFATFSLSPDSVKLVQALTPLLLLLLLLMTRTWNPLMLLEVLKSEQSLDFFSVRFLSARFHFSPVEVFRDSFRT